LLNINCIKNEVGYKEMLNTILVPFVIMTKTLKNSDKFSIRVKPAATFALDVLMIWDFKKCN
jgi:hypothetical protein